MYLVPSSFYGAKMPYFHVEISNNNSVQFVVEANDKNAAHEAAAAANARGECDGKTVLKLQENNSISVSSYTIDEAAWLDTLKKTKAK